jgi:hypothetical protein
MTENIPALLAEARESIAYLVRDGRHTDGQYDIGASVAIHAALNALEFQSVSEAAARGDLMMRLHERDRWIAEKDARIAALEARLALVPTDEEKAREAASRAAQEVAPARGWRDITDAAINAYLTSQQSSSITRDKLIWWMRVHGMFSIHEPLRTKVLEQWADAFFAWFPLEEKGARGE